MRKIWERLKNYEWPDPSKVFLMIGMLCLLAWLLTVSTFLYLAAICFWIGGIRVWTRIRIALMRGLVISGGPGPLPDELRCQAEVEDGLRCGRPLPCREHSARQ